MADIAWAQRMLPGTAVTRVFFNDQPELVSISAIRPSAAMLPHPRAFHELRFDPATLEVVKLSRYERSSLATCVPDWMLPVHDRLRIPEADHRDWPGANEFVRHLAAVRWTAPERGAPKLREKIKHRYKK